MVFFSLNTISVRFDPLHIFDAITFILHHSLKLFLNIFFLIFYSQFGIHKSILKQRLEKGKKTRYCACSILYFEGDRVHL